MLILGTPKKSAMFSRLEAKDFMKLLLLQKQNETQKKKKNQWNPSQQKSRLSGHGMAWGMSALHYE